MPDARDRSELPLTVRGAPRTPAGWRLATDACAQLDGDLLDASGMFGLPARAATRAASVSVLEPSAAGLEHLRATGEGAGRTEDLGTVRAGLPWDAAPAAYDAVVLAPPAERGGTRVEAELMAAARALRSDGAAWILLEKDRGAKRYERTARSWFGAVSVVAKTQGYRLSRMTDPRPPSDAELEARVWTHAELEGIGPAWAVAGVFAGGRLDPGTALLLRTLADPPEGTAPPALDGRTVLDLGCGWGPISAWARRRGAVVTATDDDLAAVRSCRRTVDAQPDGPAATVLHGDRDGALPHGARYDLVLVNPPFHLGAGVRTALGQAFVTAAARRLAPGGEAWIVANAALPYERRHDGPEEVRVVARSDRFKVVRLRARTHR